MADLQVENTTESYLKWDRTGAGVGLRAKIQNGELRKVHLLVDKHKGSGLAADWSVIEIHGRLGDLAVLRDFCEEAIAEIEKRVKGAK